MRRTLIVPLVSGFLAVAVSLTAAACRDGGSERVTQTLCQREQAASSEVPPISSLQEERSFRNYMVRIYRDTERDEGAFEILRDGNQVYVQKGWVFSIGYLDADGKDESDISMGADITGDGKANLVISEWTGGIHSCFDCYIFEIDQKFRKVAKIEGWHSEPVFADLDKDGDTEITLYDWTFAYWRVCFADSPAPKVILRYQNEAYELAPDLMRSPAPTLTELKEHVQLVRNGDSWRNGGDMWGNPDAPPSLLWAYMLDLIYSGNAESAWEFLDMAWPATIPGKRTFTAEFRARLATSPYWSEGKVMNKE